jgi:hypothetical protein
MADNKLKSTDYWAVTVYRDCEAILTISANSLSGRLLDLADQEAIRSAGKHLLAFVGDRCADET